MKSHPQRKQIFLFVAAVVLPSFILTIFTLRMVRQEKELALKRAGEEKRRTALEIGRAMQAVLENVRIKLTEGGQSRGKLVIWSAVARGSELRLPWEKSGDSTARTPSAVEKRYSALLREAEIAEFARTDFSAAIKTYRQALESDPSIPMESTARLSLARCLARSGQASEARAEYRRLLDLPMDIADEFGIPLAFYAAFPLVQSESDLNFLADRFKTWLESERILPPEAYFRLKDLAASLLEQSSVESGRLALTAGLGRLDERLKTAEIVLKVKSDFSSLIREWAGRLKTSADEGVHPGWLGYGPSPWLLGLGEIDSASARLLTAADGPLVLKAALASDTGFLRFPGNCRLVFGGTPDSEDLGPSFSGVKILFDAADPAFWTEGTGARVTFYFLVLIVVLIIALFGTYLLWRDVRRDVRTAEIRSRFVSSVSHELRTPLTAIRMFTDALRQGRAKDPASQQEYLEIIGSESERLSRLINNVLEFGKIERSERAYRLEPTSVEEVVARAVRLMEYPLKQKKFRLLTKIESGTPPVRADSDALEQAVLNLLLNALKYSGEAREIRLTVDCEGEWAVVRVQDFGVGVAPEHKDKIFDRFYRVPNPENRGITGAGLGLTIVKHIVDGHGGKVAVNSEIGRGSTFSIFLPLERAE